MHRSYYFFIDKFLNLVLGCALLACQPSKPKTQPKVAIEQLQDSLINHRDSSEIDLEQEPKNLPSTDIYMLSHLESIIKAMEAGDSVRWVCYGNSITHGYRVGSFGQVKEPYPEVLETYFQERYSNPNIFVINEGHNGWRSDQALHNLESMVLSQTPDAVTLMFGINDAYSNFSLDYYKSNIRGIIDRLLKENIKVLLLSPTPINSPFDVFVSRYIEVLEQIAHDKQIAWLDINQAIRRKLDHEEMTLESILPDDVHLADERYRWIAEIMFYELTQAKK